MLAVCGVLSWLFEARGCELFLGCEVLLLCGVKVCFWFGGWGHGAKGAVQWSFHPRKDHYRPASLCNQATSLVCPFGLFPSTLRPWTQERIVS